ncbi:MAG: 3-methyl-2-oxobutanoate hydroxymethyltransferase [Betaproteobacteria bacterium]|nr:MAG: 3-methyl-2-oxobutanoate hydroxymethyltransferase [Betaproteobacteria bacterium]
MFLPKLLEQAQRGERLVALTCYDATTARLLCANGVDILLVGDSLGMTLQGHDSTLPVSLADMVYHTAAVARGAAGQGFILADLNFGSYQASPAQAFASAAQLMAVGANMVKLEGGAVFVETVQFLVQRGIPVCAHLGLLPQSVNSTGYSLQARSETDAQRLLDDALALQAAGASLLVLEAIPAAVAARVTAALTIPTIGIGAGAACGGQVLVYHDLVGLTATPPSFTKNFLIGHDSLAAAVRAYAEAVKTGHFPGPEHSR